MAENTAEIDPTFVLRCKNSIDTMRGAGINDVLIACIIQEIRSLAISEEFNRLKYLLADNPPTHHTHGQMADVIEEWIDRETRQEPRTAPGSPKATTAPENG